MWNSEYKIKIHSGRRDRWRKAELLAEARQVIAEKGYKKTNISDITKRRGMALAPPLASWVSREVCFFRAFM